MSKLFFELVSNCVVDFNGRKKNRTQTTIDHQSTVRNYEHKSLGEKHFVRTISTAMIRRNQSGKKFIKIHNIY